MTQCSYICRPIREAYNRRQDQSHKALPLKDDRMKQEYDTKAGADVTHKV